MPRGGKIQRKRGETSLKADDGRGRAPIRVLIADDDDSVRLRLKRILELNPDFEVVGQARNGEEAVRFASDLRPDVVLMDVRMPGMDSIEATRRILAEAPQTKIIALTEGEVGGQDPPHDA
ncbi:MAG: response regulator transcription factor [Deltaproteobacteria bacterium]|nr:response regulator transcription factor [Deltaproteobacteria bacterium]